jgi:exosortase/archaeosortase family protein
MKDVKNKVMSFSIRYLVLVLVAIPNLSLFYYIFSPLTIYPSYWLFTLVFDASLYQNLILLNSTSVIEIIPSCVMGSAYYLLLILNLSVPGIKLGKRLFMIVSAFLTLLIINVLRIFLLGVLYTSNSPWSDPLHVFFWYFLSIIFILGIWFAQTKIFKIKEIPFYSDIKFLYQEIKEGFAKNKKDKKKIKTSKRKKKNH